MAYFESPKKTYFGKITVSHKDTLRSLSDSKHEMVSLINDRLSGHLRETDDTYRRGNIAPTGEFSVVYYHNMLLRGQILSMQAEKTAVLDCVKRYDEKLDIIGYGRLHPGPLYAIEDHLTGSTNEREAVFDKWLTALESELNADECQDEISQVSRAVIQKARTDPSYRRNFMTNIEGSVMAMSQLIEYVKGCVTFRNDHQELFQGVASIVRGMGLPWLTLSYKHESYEGFYRISLKKLENIWKTVAKQIGVDDFCLWIDHVMRLRKYSTRDWYAVGIEPFSLGTVVRYLRKPYNVAESMIDMNPGLWLSCEAILGITNKGLYCIRDGEDCVEVIDSGVRLGAKAAVEILALCFLNGRLVTKRVHHQEDAQGLANWASFIVTADYNSGYLDVSTLKQLIPDMLSLESQPKIFNRIERHLGTIATHHRPGGGEWRGIRGVIPFLDLDHKEIDREFEDSRCKIFGCDQCGKKLGVLECFLDDENAWKVVTVSGLESNVTGPQGRVLLTVKLSPMEGSMLRVGETLEGLSHVGGGFIVICDNMKLVTEMKLKDVGWIPCKPPDSDQE